MAGDGVSILMFSSTRFIISLNVFLTMTFTFSVMEVGFIGLVVLPPVFFFYKFVYAGDIAYPCILDYV